MQTTLNQKLASFLEGVPRGRHPGEGADYNSHPAPGPRESPAPLPALREKLPLLQGGEGSCSALRIPHLG